MSLKKMYTAEEWEQKVEYYSQASRALRLGDNPNTKEIMFFEARVDALLTESMLDRSYVKSNFDQIDNQVKLREKELSFQIRINPEIVTDQPLTKPTEKMIDGLVVKYLRSSAYPPFKVDIYTLKNALNERLNFIDEVVRILHDKKSALEIMARMLKIEATFKETVNGRDHE